jgi:hypothetical protein
MSFMIGQHNQPLLPYTAFTDVCLMEAHRVLCEVRNEFSLYTYCHVGLL